MDVDLSNVTPGECDDCPMRGTDGGGPGPVMTCSHPDAPDMGYIIKWAGHCEKSGKHSMVWKPTKRHSDKCPLEKE